ncbi:MAG: ABC transporter permease [Acidobacteria bacterium]|nr:ABC transporter permease [Acidobacteriota bacterium]
MPEPKRVRIARWAILLIILVSWELIGTFDTSFNFLLGTPSQIIVELSTLVRSGEFFHDAYITGAEALGGLVLGTVVGTLAGLTVWLSNSVAAATRPFVFALSSFPVFAIAPLMIVWFGVGIEMKIAFATLATVFVAFNQAYSGAHMVSKDYLEVMRGFGASRWLQFRKIVVPSSLDWVLAALRVNTGLSLLGAFIGEFVAADSGLGHVIMAAASLYKVPKALAAAFGIVLLAACFNWLAGLIEKHRGVLIQYISVPKAIRKYK